MKHCYTNIQEHDWSRAYTFEGKTDTYTTVSKSITPERIVMTNIIDSRPLHLFFNKTMPLENYNKYMDDLKEQFSNLECQTVLCQSWDQLGSYIRDHNVKSIAFCPDELGYTKAYEIVNMTKTLSKLLGKNDIKISIALFKNLTTINEIKDLQKSGIDGIIPSHVDFGWEETQKALEALWAKIPYWPKHIIEQLPGAEKPKSKIKPGEVKLTPRQTNRGCIQSWLPRN